MTVLSKIEFQEECARLQLKGKCAVLLNGVISKETKEGEVIKEFKSLKCLNYKFVQSVLINFLVSPNFSFFEFEKRMFLILENIPHDLDVVVTVTYADNIPCKQANITVMISKLIPIMALVRFFTRYINKLKDRG